MSDASLFAIGAACPSLVSINLSGIFNISDAGIEVLAQGCPALTSVDLSLCSRLTDASVEHLVEYCPDLRSAGLSYLEITDASVAAALAAPRLESLDVSNCLNVSDEQKARAEQQLSRSS